MGQSCQCTTRNSDNDEQWMFEEPEKPNTGNLDLTPARMQIQEDSDPCGVEAVTPDPEDPIQLPSYEWEDNKPKETYARPLFQNEEQKIKINEIVLNTYQKQTVASIKCVSPNYLRIPSKSNPFIILENKDIYVGQWADGKPFGIGVLYSKFNEKTQSYDQFYEGQLEVCIPNGEGTIIYQDGTVYRGEFKMGQIEGMGKLTKVDHFCYNGEWKNNQPHGKGFEKWPNKTTYIGDYFEGKKQGKGRFTWSNKDNKKDNEENKAQQEVYDGEFLDNLFEGKGSYEWPDGREYEGGWRRGKMDGTGIFKWSDGKMYVGQYENDQKHGKGVFTFTKDKVLTGFWMHGKMDGLGQLQYKGKTYQGEWRMGDRVRWIRDNQDSSSIMNNSLIMGGIVIPNEMGKSTPKIQKVDDSINKISLKSRSNIISPIGENKAQRNAVDEDSEHKHQKDVLQILNQQAQRQIDEKKEKSFTIEEKPEEQLDFIDRQRKSRREATILATAKEAAAKEAAAKEAAAKEAADKEAAAKEAAAKEAAAKEAAAKEATAKDVIVVATVKEDPVEATVVVQKIDKN